MTQQEMTCEILAAHLTDFLEGDLPEPAEVAALDHLSTCESCEGVLVSTRDVVKLSREHGRVHLDDADRAKLLAKLLENVE